MWLLAFALTGALTGFIAGMLLSEVISIAGYLLMHRSVTIPYLSLYLTGIGALVGLLLARRRPDVKP